MTKTRKNTAKVFNGVVRGEKTQVFRVVDAEGFGYKASLDSNIGSVACIDYTNYYERRPLPGDDLIDLELLDENWFFGFESIDHLKSWFLLDERNAGTHFNGQILEIEVDRDFVVKGNRQLVFHADYAITRAAHPLNGFDTEEDRRKPFDVD